MLSRRVLQNFNVHSAFFAVGVALPVFTASLIMVLTLHLPYWFDEVNSIRHVLKDFPTFITYIGSDNQMPLYFFALRLWVAFFGTSAAATAWLSMVFNLLATSMTYRLGQRLFGSRRTALTAAAFYWCSYAAIYFATETRMYSLLSAIVAASTLRLWLLIRRGRRSDLRWYWVASFAGVMTHYLYWVVVFSQNIIILFFRHRLNFHFRSWVFSQCVLVASFLPWFPFFWQRFSTLYLSGFGTWLDNAPQFTWTVFFSNLSNLLAPLPQHVSLFKWVMLLAGVVAFFGLLVNLRFGRWFIQLNAEKLAGAGGFIFAAFALPFFIIIVLNLGAIRYLAYLTPLLACAGAAGLRRCPLPWIRSWLTIAVLATSVVANFQHAVNDPMNRYRYYWPRVAAQIEQQETTTPSALVFLTSAEEEFLFHYYYRGDLPVVSFLPTARQRDTDRELSIVKSVGIQYVTAKNSEEIGEQIRDYWTVWVLSTWGTISVDPQAWQKLWFTEHCQLVQEYLFYDADPTLQLFRYEGCRSLSRSGSFRGV